MTTRSLGFRIGAVVLAAGLMGGYVVYQAVGGDAKLFAGSKSAPVTSRGKGAPATAPATRPETQPAAIQKLTPQQIRLLVGSKSAAVFTPPAPSADNGQPPQAEPPPEAQLQPAPSQQQPRMMGGSKSIIVFKPAQQAAPATQPNK